MPTWSIVLLCILAVLIIGVVVLYFLGKKAQKKQAEQEEMMQANKQTISMLIIDQETNEAQGFRPSTGCHRPDTQADAPFQASHWSKPRSGPRSCL